MLADPEYAITEGRALAEELMTDTCVITRPGTTPVTDPDTGVVTTPEVVVYPDPAWPDDHPWKHGPCKVQNAEPQEFTDDVGESEQTVQRYRLDVPVDSLVPRVGYAATITPADTALDPFLIGHRFRVVALLHKSQATAYRLGVKQEV